MPAKKFARIEKILNHSSTEIAEFGPFSINQNVFLGVLSVSAVRSECQLRFASCRLLSGLCALPYALYPISGRASAITAYAGSLRKLCKEIAPN